MGGAGAGWYQDPHDRDVLRWWNGGARSPDEESANSTVRANRDASPVTAADVANAVEAVDD